MTPEQLTQSKIYKKEFEDAKTTDERRAELVAWVQERAAEDGETQACWNCKKLVVMLDWHEGVAEGHIYSHDGMREYRISRVCEFCFDKLTAEPEEEDESVDA